MGQDLASLIYETVRLSGGNGPEFILNGETVDIWQEPFRQFHSKTASEYVRDTILEGDSNGKDLFSEIVGKATEKELIKDALFSSSPILLRGERGYGKTSMAKSIGRLLPDRILSVKGCKIHDDPTRPVCFSCKAKIKFSERVELTWVPRMWVRIPGDPMMTTRQLVGGISIQKIREGLDLDDPEVFIPGKALKAHRGVGYYDELGAIPTSLQTLLHELFEEGQITSAEGDILPFGIDSIELASTNPANYRGTSPIKEPLLDRMELIEIGPPESLEDEIEIGRRNIFYASQNRRDAEIPIWHSRILARVVRFARVRAESDLARKVRIPPSCRATIKLLDHVKSKALRRGRQIPLLEDYGIQYHLISLALEGRMELEYGVKESKGQIIRALVEESIRETCREIYRLIPAERFDDFYTKLMSIGAARNGESIIDLHNENVLSALNHNQAIGSVLGQILNDLEESLPDEHSKEVLKSVLEMVLHSLFICAPNDVRRKTNGVYILKVMSDHEESMRRLR